MICITAKNLNKELKDIFSEMCLLKNRILLGIPYGYHIVYDYRASKYIYEFEREYCIDSLESAGDIWTELVGIPYHYSFCDVDAEDYIKFYEKTTEFIDGENIFVSVVRIKMCEAQKVLVDKLNELNERKKEISEKLKNEKLI